ncbi:hypothetical protein BKA80DRAFT_143068 [Phyllosticta citrichinensis]
MKRYFEKGLFADMTVSDSTGKKYHVHKVVLGSTSLVLAKMIEELSGCSKSSEEVDLGMHRHRPEIVEQGLYFKYNQHYYEPLDLRTFHEQPRPKQEGEDLRPRILFSTEVHAFAVSYYTWKSTPSNKSVSICLMRQSTSQKTCWGCCCGCARSCQENKKVLRA